MCYQMEKMMKEHAGKLKDSDKQPLEAAIKKARDAAEGEDLDAIKSAVQELEQTSHALSKVMYENAAKPDGKSDEGEPTSYKDDDAIDAEFEVKKD
ncbi:MAG: Hsp70 family protein, partial [Pirellulaceae bacterium]